MISDASPTLVLDVPVGHRLDCTQTVQPVVKPRVVYKQSGDLSLALLEDFAGMYRKDVLDVHEMNTRSYLDLEVRVDQHPHQ
jgi:hypothetical protein